MHYITNNQSLKTPEIDLPFDWSVVAVPEDFAPNLKGNELYSQLSNNTPEAIRRYKVKSYKADYIFGTTRPMSGNLNELEFTLPSSIAFIDRQRYAISSGDTGDIVIVNNGRYKRYKFTNELGMPAKISNLVYLGDNKYLYTDNRTHTINQLSAETGEVIRLAGIPNELYGQKLYENYRPENLKKTLDIKRAFNGTNEPLGIFRGLTVANQNAFLVMGAGYKRHARSWYSMGLNTKAYKSRSGNNYFQWLELTSLNSICATESCKEVTLISNSSSDLLVRTNNRLIRTDIRGIEKWSVPLKHTHGSGLLVFAENNQALLGDRTYLLSVNLNSGKHHEIQTSERFANISDIKKIPSGGIAVVDSDAAIVYFGHIERKTFQVEASIGERRTSYPGIADMRMYDDNLYVLTTNPSYLFSISIKNFETKFLIGNGLNIHANFGDAGYKSSMYYPTSFVKYEDDIFIAEANTRIIQVDNKGRISLYAGTLKSGRGNGVLKCESKLFKSIRGISNKNDSLYIADSGNNRLIKLQKKEHKKCEITNLPITNRQGGIIKLNFPTTIRNTNTGFYLVNQNNNNILHITDDGLLKHRIGRPIAGTYQGQGSYKSEARSDEALFNTPASLAIGESGKLYIGDLFNGFIRIAHEGYVGDLPISCDTCEKYIWPTSIEIVESTLYFADGLDKKTYMEPLPQKTSVLSAH